MFSRKFHICDLFGIPVYLDISTAILLLFFIGNTGSLALDLLSAAMLLFSIVLHELGHSLTGRMFGCSTRNIVLTVIGGCASMTSIPRKAWQELLMAAAGPAVSFALAFAFILSSALCASEFLRALFAISAWMNLALGLFNLLPGFPMDGGRIFRSLVRAFTSRVEATRIAMIVGRAAAVLLVAGPFFGINHIWIIPIGGSLFMRILIAFMIWNEGYREYQTAVMESRWGFDGDGGWFARVSPPPYGGNDDETEVRRG